MNVTAKSPVRPLLVGGVAGLIVGCLIGWLAIGWWLWPVEYVGEAYTYELNETDKMQYVAAVADSYNLTKQVDVAQQRLNAWTIEEKVSALAKLFVEDQVQGKSQEADQVAVLASDLQRVEGWDPAVVGQVVNEAGLQYTQQGAPDRAQALSLFANALGATAAAPSPAPISTPSISGPGAQMPVLGNVGALLRWCGALLLIAVLVLAVLALRRRALRMRPVTEEPEAEWTGIGPPPLLQKTSSYRLGMDNFDESFAIETEENEWLGECGVGISESVGDGTPRRVVAFEVWLFDKPNTRTVTKVLMSDFANSNEPLRNKLVTRGDPVLAAPGETFTLETPALSVNAQIVEMEYGEGTPAFGYFKNLTVSLTVHPRAETDMGTVVA